MKLSDIGEFGLIQRLAAEFGIEYPPRRGATAPGFLVPLGDDAVVTDRHDEALIWTTDTMVAGEHFDTAYCSWQDVGWKALASNVSDIAAMAGTPRLALVTLMLPADFCVDDAVDVYHGLYECASRFDVRLGGGDIVRSPHFAVTVALSGKVAYFGDAGGDGEPVVLRRDAAREGDLVAVTGTLGDSAGGLKLLAAGREATSEPEMRLANAHLRPSPRVELAAAAVAHGLSCGMDISDGLVQDLGHIAKASGVGIIVEAERVPVSTALQAVWPVHSLEFALSGGEDYELALIGPTEAMGPYVSFTRGAVTVIGRVTAPATREVTVIDGNGRPIELRRGGWDHFVPT